MCGENGESFRPRAGLCGTPPRVWGKPRPNLENIPDQQVHPHVCGENDKIKVMLAAPVGTPPRVWGKPSCGYTNDTMGRYTPTCVGKTILSRSAVRRVTVHPHVCGENEPHFLAHIAEKVHPHVCGENSGLIYFVIALSGTPPRVWGKLPFYDIL